MSKKYFSPSFEIVTLFIYLSCAFYFYYFVTGSELKLAKIDDVKTAFAALFLPGIGVSLSLCFELKALSKEVKSLKKLIESKVSESVAPHGGHTGAKGDGPKKTKGDRPPSF